jgi:hypothetical protein
MTTTVGEGGVIAVPVDAAAAIAAAAGHAVTASQAAATATTAATTATTARRDASDYATIARVQATAAVTALSGLATAVDDGVVSSGTYQPATVGGNMRRIVNGGDFIFVPPDSGDGTLIVKVTNSASAGAVTFSGFDAVGGDVLTVTPGDVALIYMTTIDGYARADVVT